MNGFRAHKNGVQQTLRTDGVYVRLDFPFSVFDTGPCFDPTTGLFTPPSGIIAVSGQLFSDSGFVGAGNPIFVLKMVKNPVFDSDGNLLSDLDINAGFGDMPTVPWAGVARLPMSVDLASGTDTYALVAYARMQGGTPMVLDANPAHTWFNGVW